MALRLRREYPRVDRYPVPGRMTLGSWFYVIGSLCFLAGTLANAYRR